MKYVFNLVWNLLLKNALEVQDINRTIKFITVLYSDQPFPSITIGVKDFGIVIAQSSHTEFFTLSLSCLLAGLSYSYYTF